MTLEPLKITFTVAGGWAAPALPLHLDAVLAYCVTQRGLEDIEEAPSVQALRALADDLPLARHEQEGSWVWKASAIVPAVAVVNDSGFYTQRRDEGVYAAGVGSGQIQHGRYRPGSTLEPYQLKIDTARGVYRNLLGFYPTQRAFDSGLLTLQAWCIGYRDLIDELLNDDRRPTHLGARRRAGLGRITSVAVEPDSSATEQWTLRVKPWPLRADDVAIQAACNPPYWAAENRMSAFIPTGL